MILVEKLLRTLFNIITCTIYHVQNHLEVWYISICYYLNLYANLVRYARVLFNYFFFIGCLFLIVCGGLRIKEQTHHKNTCLKENGLHHAESIFFNFASIRKIV